MVEKKWTTSLTWRKRERAFGLHCCDCLGFWLEGVPSDAISTEVDVYSFRYSYCREGRRSQNDSIKTILEWEREGETSLLKCIKNNIEMQWYKSNGEPRKGKKRPSRVRRSEKKVSTEQVAAKNTCPFSSRYFILLYRWWFTNMVRGRCCRTAAKEKNSIVGGVAWCSLKSDVITMWIDIDFWIDGIEIWRREIEEIKFINSIKDSNVKIWFWSSADLNSG